LGFDGLGDGVFKQLVLARMIEPVSKLGTIRVLSAAAPDLLDTTLCSIRVQEREVRHV